MKLCAKNKLYMIGALVILLVMGLKGPLACAENPSRGQVRQPLNQEVAQKKEYIRRLMKQKEGEGTDVSAARLLLEQSRIAMQHGNTEECLRLLDRAVASLGEENAVAQTKSESIIPTKSIVRKIELPVGSGQFEVIELVPNHTSGKDIERYTSAFESYPLISKNGHVQLSVGSVPLMVKDVPNQKDTVKSEQIVSDCKDSPFGIHDIDKFDDRLVDLGTCWVRNAGRTSLVWNIAEPEKGKFDWSRTDAVLNDLHRNNICMIVNISTFNHWDQGRERGRGSKKLVKDINAYQSFLEKAVQRYPFVNAWQIENEPNNPMFWADTPENYLILLKASYQAIKHANPDALVVIGGASHPRALDENFWSQIFMLLEKEKEKAHCFDVFDCHWFLHADRHMENIEQLTEYIQNVRKKLDKVGYQDVPVWIAEMASYSAKPEGMSEASEQQHASELVKLYVRSLSLGVSKIFWVRLIEWSGFKGRSNGYFDNTGLISNPLNHGDSHEKLAYYSYKKLVEAFKGVNLKTAEALTLANHIQAYKFLKDGRPIYFVWGD